MSECVQNCRLCNKFILSQSIVFNSTVNQLIVDLPAGSYGNCQKYCIDNRIHSTTKGELYDRYPSKEGAKILNKEDFKIL